MASTPAYEQRRRVSLRRPETEDNESSLLLESQSLWVVFNPADRLDNDVLLFSTTNPLTEGEAEEEEEEEYHGGLQLLLRIDRWQNTTDAEVLDNIALWDLDSELVAQLLDTLILRKVPAFYGDHYFDGMSKTDYARFRRASSLLRKLLTRKGADKVDSQLILRLLQLLLWQNLLNTLGTLVNDYIFNTLARSNMVPTPCREAERSDTASSSLVMCGSSSWNDI